MRIFLAGALLAHLDSSAFAMPSVKVGALRDIHNRETNSILEILADSCVSPIAADPGKLCAFLTSPDFAISAFKGVPLSMIASARTHRAFRVWATEKWRAAAAGA